MVTTMSDKDKDLVLETLPEAEPEANGKPPPTELERLEAESDMIEAKNRNRELKAAEVISEAGFADAEAFLTAKAALDASIEKHRGYIAAHDTLFKNHTKEKAAKENLEGLLRRAQADIKGLRSGQPHGLTQVAGAIFAIRFNGYPYTVNLDTGLVTYVDGSGRKHYAGGTEIGSLDKNYRDRE